MKFFKKKALPEVRETINLEDIEKRWKSSSIHELEGLGFNLPANHFEWLTTKSEHYAKCLIEGNETIDFWPLDEKNFKFTSKLAGFLSMTIGVFQSGAHVVIGLSGPPSKVMFIDNDGKGNQIYLIISYDEFFSSLN